MKRSRFKVTVVVIFALFVCAILKHFLPGLSIEILGLAVATAVKYMWDETKRPSG